jgi:putative SOS response-associated peptidase YedK
MCYSAMVRQDLKYLEDKYGVSIVRESFERYETLSLEDSKTYRPMQSNPRIFPLYFAPIIYQCNDQLVVEPMRYQAWPADHKEDPRKLSLYNARLDNLKSKFWSSMFCHHHGFAVLTAFYEWVEVRDLLKTGRITLRDVESLFLVQSKEKAERAAAEGKKYSPTPTEKKPALQRKVIIEFKPTQSVDMLVPVIFAIANSPHAGELKSFAIITTEPPSEVSQAGHDRCPVNLPLSKMMQFVTPPFNSPDAILKLLASKPAEIYDYKLA